MKQKNTMIVMMGGPGTGKGTFSRMLREMNPDFKYIDTGAILRSLPPESEIRKIIAGGNLLPDETVSKIVGDAIDGMTGNVILDGFPRSVGQAEYLIKNYADKYDVHVLFLNARDDVMKKHIIKRRNEGSGRQDDSSEDIINTRIAAFHKTTMPAIKWIGSNAKDVRFRDVDSNCEERENFARVLKALRLEKVNPGR